jgi:hypothetical protein
MLGGGLVLATGILIGIPVLELLADVSRHPWLTG